MVEDKDKKEEKDQFEELESLLEELDKDNTLNKKRPPSELPKEEGEEDKFEEKLFETPEETPEEKELEDIIEKELFAVEEEEITPFEEEELEAIEEIVPEIPPEKVIKKKEIVVPPKKKRFYFKRALTYVNRIRKNKALMRIVYLSICIIMIIGVSFHMINRYIKGKSYLYKGISAIERKDFKKAEEFFQKSLKYSYAKIKVYHKFAQSYAPFNPDKAIELLNKALSKKPKDLELLKSLLIIYGDQLNLKQAKKIYNRILEIDPKNVDARVNLGWIYFRLKDIEKASLVCEEALSIKYKHVEALFLLQSILMERKMYNAAVGVHRFIYKLTDEKECNPDILYKLGRVYLKRDRKKLAKELFRTVIKHDPSNLKARYYLGTFFYEDGMKNRAAACFKYVINKDPNFADAHNYLGLIYYEKGMFKKAYERFRDCLKLRPLHKESLYNMGNLYFYYFNDLKESRRLYEKAYQLGIKNPTLHYNLGIIYYQNKEYKKALIEWKKLIPKEIKNPHLNFNLGSVKILLNRPYHALENLKTSLKSLEERLRKARKKETFHQEQRIYQQISKIYNNQGVVYELLGKKREAMTSYSQAIEYASWAKKKNEIAYKNLQRLFHGIPIGDIHEHLNNELSKFFKEMKLKKKPVYLKAKKKEDIFTYTLCFLVALFIFGSYKLLVRKKSFFDLIYEIYKRVEKTT